MLKKLLITLYIVVVVVMAATTIIEKYYGTAHVQTYYYGSWWFTLVWALLTAVAITWFIRRKVRRWPVVLLHLSFVVILAGALLTHLFSTQGYIHLRIGETTQLTSTLNPRLSTLNPRLSTLNCRHSTLDHTTPSLNREGQGGSSPLITLDTFRISYHDGTDAAANYTSRITIAADGKKTTGEISMNHIFTYGDYRFYQSSYDEDGKGCTLAYNADSWGIPVTYTGYAILFFSLVYMLIDPKGTFRRLLRNSLPLIFFLLTGTSASASPHALSREEAQQFGKLHLLYRERICPVETYALDFTKKLCGKRHYDEYSAEQVLTGFIFWGEEWDNEPILKVKGGELRQELHLNDYCSVNDLFHTETGYILGPYIQQYYSGNIGSIYKQAAQLDDKLRLIMELRKGKTLTVFPVTRKGTTKWYSPTEKLPGNINPKNREFIKLAFSTLYRDTQTENHEHFMGAVNDMRRFQYNNGGTSLPSSLQIQAERIYNRIPFTTILFMFNLTVGILMLFWILFSIVYPQYSIQAIQRIVFPLLLLLSFCTLTYSMTLRWIISGTIPMSNGYETMLLIAWFIMLVTLTCYLMYLSRRPSSLDLRPSTLVLLFGFLLSGFFLLVSHISQMDPDIGRIMPVLNSPLLSIHVSIIMMAYALLSLTFVCSLTALVATLLRRLSPKRFHKMREYASNSSSALRELRGTSLLFLYPALTCLGLGIFIGAIWANVSWGCYWSWDPKETWALITLMVYAVPVHAASLPLFRKPIAFHIYIILAFLTMLMTYFGVNYFLGGMHSYA